MRHVRASSGRRAAAVAADVTAVADTVVGGVTVAVASEEAATSQPALPADRCCRVRGLSGFALGADLISCAEDSAHYSAIGKIWAGLDSNQRRRKASRFTVCPVWPLRYLPVSTTKAFRVDIARTLRLASSLANPRGLSRRIRQSR